MIDKYEFYHGAAIVRLLQDERCAALCRKGLLGYVLNNSVFLFIKYTTKARSPWRFSFDKEDIERADKMALEHERVVFPFVCGGDGICALDWSEARRLLDGNPGWIAVARKHNGQYAVWGSVDEHERRISKKRWPEIGFEAMQPMPSPVQPTTV